jgi:hypothetical protein
MESGIYLTALVFAVGILHLAWKCGDTVHRFYTQGKRQSSSHKKPVQRSDWYMFFYCSDLTGEKKEKARDKRVDSEKGVSQETLLRQDSRSRSYRYSA